MSARPFPIAARRRDPVIIGQDGRPLMSRYTAHEGADQSSAELASWQPGFYSADGELLEELRTLQGRTDDIIRNNGLASGAVQTHLDNVIGAGLRLMAKPDWALLGVTDKEYARNWERTVEAKFRNYVMDPDCYIDAGRRMRWPELLSQAYRSYLTQFEIVATAEWLKRPGSKYRTAIQMLDPKLLCNPRGVMDGPKHRGGIDLGPMGEPVKYWFASSVEGDRIMLGDLYTTWKGVARETPWGRQQVIHIYDYDKPGRSRGKNHGIVATLAKLKMLEKFEQATLQASILNAMYAATIKTSVDWPSAYQALGADNDDNNPMTKYLEQVMQWNRENSARYNGAKVTHLYPGEELDLATPKHPSAQFNMFEEAVLRYIAAGWNLSYEQLSRDYSKTNYSSARAAMLEGYRFFNGQQIRVGGRCASSFYCLWLEEAMDKGEVETPPGAPDYYDAKAAYCGSQWIGPPRGHIDPLKEANATLVELRAGLTTLEKEAALRGEDWEELTEQRAQQMARTREIEREYELPEGSLGLPDETPVAQPAEVTVDGAQNGGGDRQQQQRQQTEAPQ